MSVNQEAGSRSRGEEYRAILASETGTIQEKANTALKIITESLFALYDDALDFLHPLITENDRDPNLLHLLAYAAWVRNRHDMAHEYARRNLAVAADNINGYRVMTMNYLVQGRDTEAFLAASAGMHNCPQPEPLKDLQQLSRLRMSGVRNVKFTSDGVQYIFALSCFNGQAMETALHHINARIIERDELDYLKQFVGSAKTIVEIGILVGNHTVWFLRNLAPDRIIAIDADARSIRQASENFSLNRDGAHTTLETILSGVGEKKENTVIAGVQASVDTLDNLVSEPFDFIKVDVDGWEIPFLRGARETLEKYRPKMMIEVKNEFAAEFQALLEAINYRIAHRIERNVDANYFVEPVS